MMNITRLLESMSDLLSTLGAPDFAAIRNPSAGSFDVTGSLMRLTLSALNVGIAVFYY
jgi:hypothetical protein